MAKKRRRQLPADPPRQKVHSALQRLGFSVAREGAKHTIYRDHAGRIVSIPRHPTVKRGLLRGELEGVGISEKQFMTEY